MKKERTYLDYNATTPLKPAVAEVMQEAWQQPANASSVHVFGREAKKRIEVARDAVAKLVGAGEAHQVVFTSSGTEANNLALKGLQGVDAVFASAVEHISVLKGSTIEPTRIPVGPEGVVDLVALKEMLEATEGKALVSVMLANNETGVIQPVAEIAKLVYEHNGFIHCDAAQAVGKIAVDIQELNVDMLTISAHKFGGPVGAAALIIKKGISLAARITGGGQEVGYKAGTENVAAIAGFGKAAELATENLAKMSVIETIRDEMEAELLEHAPDAVVASKKAIRLANTSCISLPNMKNEVQLIAFDLEGVAVSAGSACSSGKVDVSHVLTAMGWTVQEASEAIRISLGPETTTEEVERFTAVWKALYARANARSKVA
jgi:cysteine desulfurase